MRRVCFLLRLKKEMVEEYKKNHRVWPEMRQAIRETGIRNYSMFIRPDGLLIGYFEAGSGDLQKDGPEWLEQIFYLEG